MHDYSQTKNSMEHRANDPNTKKMKNFNWTHLSLAKYCIFKWKTVAINLTIYFVVFFSMFTVDVDVRFLFISLLSMEHRANVVWIAWCVCYFCFMFIFLMHMFGLRSLWIYMVNIDHNCKCSNWTLNCDIFHL